MAEALSIFNELESAKVIPNLRTFNTLFRGCARCGDLKKTDTMYSFSSHFDFDRLESMKKYNIEADSSTFESIIKAVCQASDIERGWKIVQEMESKLVLYVLHLIGQGKQYILMYTLR